jgi:hypothetical protein
LALAAHHHVLSNRRFMLGTMMKPELKTRSPQLGVTPNAFHGKVGEYQALAFCRWTV